MFEKKIMVLVLVGLIAMSSFLLPDFGFGKKKHNSKPPISMEEEGPEGPPQDMPIDDYVIPLFFSGILMGGFIFLRKTRIQ
jgi:hypothetical protein